ncbi:MAG: N-6 DNA methylase, partial [bacterium]
IRQRIRTAASYNGKTPEDFVFVCVSNDYDSVRFANFRTPGTRQPRLSVFGWERARISETRTLRDYNLRKLKLDFISARESVWDQTTIDDWHLAWNVEKVTQNFFDEYRDLFASASDAITGITGDAKTLFTQKLFDRLLFIRFLEKKGWLSFDGRHDYLRALWDNYHAHQDDNSNFFNDRLKLLFYSGLNNPQTSNLMTVNGGGLLRDLIGDVPYLNGGLFDAEEDITISSAYPTLDIPDAAISPFILDLLYAYNFTITESTPDDIEVAVDPEMLGKVFEELVTDRGGKGAYYTPRVVVSFMCRETLKGALGGYEELIDHHNPAGIELETARILLRQIEAMRIVDPACGSGAYLLGMLHELHTLTNILDTKANEVPRDNYKRKLAIIQHNIYGVDLDDFAVNIARLRLWLSLAVEYDGTTPEPLPNLDFKIQHGDSLTAPDPTDLRLFRDKLIEKADAIAILKDQYADPYYTGTDKKSLKQEIESQLTQLETEANTMIGITCPAGAFDWRVRFAEVFKPTIADEQGGFHIVIANPPYGADVDDKTRDNFFDPRTEKGQSKNSYGLFMARALQLLRPAGMFSFIVSDTWRTLRTHKPLRKRLLKETTVKHVLDLPPWIFAATVTTCILTLKKTPSTATHKLIAGDLTAIERNNWQLLEQNLRAVAEGGVDMQTTSYARYTYLQSVISSYANLSFFIGSSVLYALMSDARFQPLGRIADVKVGLQTGDNDYYELIVKPPLRGN